MELSCCFKKYSYKSIALGCRLPDIYSVAYFTNIDFPCVNVEQVTKRDYAPESVWKNWLWRSEGDLMMKGAFFIQSGNPKQSYPKKDLISPKPGSYVPRLTHFSGALSCVANRQC
ncbi:hypothetical protein RHSIM_Rhsim08G0159400 [Rhododendron simsii]|uniref:Uncharacterized protein n=1 Tax=Rhododendron simsii TaxID=118357 RepID=A0A834GNJ6_RHOSS|nr:hypothetical protein RHSIM_Rhsim08G0159400 [Rhododendron simsii]